jgi:ATP-dependent RNA helicase DeaD
MSTCTARGYMPDRLHGDLSQAQRNRVMEKFREREVSTFSSPPTSPPAGWTSTTLEVVFNFDLPNDAEDYTHRIGRTGSRRAQGARRSPS